MSTLELIRKLKRYARENKLEFEVKKHQSKGSHRRLYIGNRNTTAPWASDLTAGVLHGILKQLEIDKDDFF